MDVGLDENNKDVKSLKKYNVLFIILASLIVLYGIIYDNIVGIVMGVNIIILVKILYINYLIYISIIGHINKKNEELKEFIKDEKRNSKQD